MAVTVAIYPLPSTSVTRTAGPGSQLIALPPQDGIGGSAPLCKWVMLSVVSTVSDATRVARQDAIQFNFVNFGGGGVQNASFGTTLTSDDSPMICRVPEDATSLAVKTHPSAMQDCALEISGLNQPGPP